MHFLYNYRGYACSIGWLSTALTPQTASIRPPGCSLQPPINLCLLCIGSKAGLQEAACIGVHCLRIFTGLLLFCKGVLHPFHLQNVLHNFRGPPYIYLNILLTLHTRQDLTYTFGLGSSRASPYYIISGALPIYTLTFY